MMTTTQLFQTERQQTAAIDRLRALKLSEFRFEHTWLKVESKLLPSLEYGEIFIASDNETKREIKAKHKSAVVYLPAELKRIIDLDPGPEAMKAIHAIKAILRGRVVWVKKEINSND